MAVSPLIPQSFWFRLTLPCPHDPSVGRSRVSGPWQDLPASCRMLPTSTIEGQAPWSEVRIAWSSEGLLMQVAVEGKVSPIRHDRYALDNSDGFRVWIDTRDTHDVHRATRFCHQFQMTLVPEKSGKLLGVQREQRPIHRALADAPLAASDAISARAEKQKSGWRLEVFFSAEALNGFDPETNRRLGIAYQVTDPDRGDQFLTVGRDFPIGEDPSLWASLELRDG